MSTIQHHPVTITAPDGLPWVDIEREFDATPEQVFRAHTEPDLVSRNEHDELVIVLVEERTYIAVARRSSPGRAECVVRLGRVVVVGLLVESAISPHRREPVEPEVGAHQREMADREDSSGGERMVAILGARTGRRTRVHATQTHDLGRRSEADRVPEEPVLPGEAQFPWFARSLAEQRHHRPVHPGRNPEVLLENVSLLFEPERPPPQALLVQRVGNRRVVPADPAGEEKCSGSRGRH